MIQLWSQASAPITAQDGWDRYTADHIALFDHLRIDRCHVSKIQTPCLVLAGNDEAHPYPISEELSKLLPNCEFIAEWKTGAALTSAKTRVKEFLAKHTPSRA